MISMQRLRTRFYSVILAGLALPGLVSAVTCPTGYTAVDKTGTCMPTNNGLPSATVKDIVEKGLSWMLGLFGVVGMIAFVISGTLYLTAAGDAEQEKKAKKAMQVSIIGVIVGLAGLVALQAVDALLRGELIVGTWV